jgi:hypothetical protein
MKELIIKYLKDKTRVVVTHALQYLKYMDRIIYMKGGRIEWVGTYKELHDQEFFLSMKKLSKLNAESSMNDSGSKENEKKNANAIKGITDSGREIIKIIKEEDEEIGSVKMGVYLDYSRYMGGTLFLLMIAFIMSMWQANKGGSDYGWHIGLCLKIRKRVKMIKNLNGYFLGCIVLLISRAFFSYFCVFIYLQLVSYV